MHWAPSSLCFETSDEPLGLLFQETVCCNCPRGSPQHISPPGYGEIWGETNCFLWLFCIPTAESSAWLLWSMRASVEQHVTTCTAQKYVLGEAPGGRGRTPWGYEEGGPVLRPGGAAPVSCNRKAAYTGGFPPVVGRCSHPHFLYCKQGALYPSPVHN